MDRLLKVCCLLASLSGLCRSQTQTLDNLPTASNIVTTTPRLTGEWITWHNLSLCCLYRSVLRIQLATVTIVQSGVINSTTKVTYLTLAGLSSLGRHSGSPTIPRAREPAQARVNFINPHNNIEWGIVSVWSYHGWRLIVGGWHKKGFCNYVTMVG